MRKLRVNPDFKVARKYYVGFAERIARTASKSTLFENRTPVLVIQTSELQFKRLERALKREFKKAGLRAPVYAKAVPKSARSVVFQFEIEKGVCQHCAEPFKSLNASLGFYDGLKLVLSNAEVPPEPKICRACGLEDADEQPVAYAETDEVGLLDEIDSL